MKRLFSQLPLILLSFGAILRVIGTGASAIWYDESNIFYRSTIPFLTLFSEKSDNSGDLLLELLLRLPLALSHSLWILRLPSLLAGLLSLCLAWRIMQMLEFTHPQKIVASTLIALLPGLIWVSQDARSYSLLTLLFLAGILLALQGRWLGLLAVCGLTVYAHNTGPFCALAALAVMLYVHPKQYRQVLIAAAGAALAWIPAVIRMSGHWIQQQPWQPLITPDWFSYSVIRAFWPFEASSMFMFQAFTTLVVSLLLLISLAHARGRLVPLISWLVPVVGLVLAGILTNNNFVLYRTLMPFLIPFCLWLGWELGQRRLSSYLPAACWGFLLLAGLSLWNPADRGGGLDLAAEKIRTEWRVGDQLVYTTSTVGQPFEYYLGDLPHTWDDTVQNGFLFTPPYLRDTLLPPTGSVERRWIVIPRDNLITPAERSVLDAMVGDSFPVHTIRYMQAADIDVFLVGTK